MKIEHERSGKGRRWSIELDPWLERALAAAIATGFTGAGAALVHLLRLTGT